MKMKSLKDYGKACLVMIMTIVGIVMISVLVSGNTTYAAENDTENSVPAITDFSGTVGEDGFTLSWNCNADSYMYRISYSQTLKGSYTVYGTYYADSKGNHQIEVDDVEKGIPYYYKIELITYYVRVESDYYWGYETQEVDIDQPVPVYTTKLKIKLDIPVITSITSAKNCIMNITWNGVDGATGYKLYRSTSKNGTYKKVGSRKDIYAESGSYYYFSDAEYQYAVKDLQYGQRYYYKVRPYVTWNGVTYYGNDSKVMSKKVTKDYVVPKISGFHVESENGCANIKWKSNVSDYTFKLYYANAKNGKYKLITGKNTDDYYWNDSDGYTNYCYTNIKEGINYYFKIVITSFNTEIVDKNATLTTGYVKKKSKAVRSQKYIESLDKPSLKISNLDSQRLELSWYPVDGASGYYIYRSESKKGPFVKVGVKKKKNGIYEETYVDSKLALGKTYYYKICPYVTYKNKKYPNTYSNVCSRKVILDPVSIRNAVTKTPGTITITWNKVPKATGYTVYCATSGTGKYKKLKEITGKNTTTFTHTGLTNGKAYYYKVEAYRMVKGKKVKSKKVKSTSEPYEKYCDYYGYEEESYYSRSMRIQGKPSVSQYASYEEAVKNMKTITIKVWDLDSNKKYYTRTFSLTVNKNIAPTVEQIFKEIYNCKERTPIHSIGGFSWTGTKNEHKLGLAIDVNPNENPMYDDGVIVVGSLYDPKHNPYSIADNSEFVRIMRKYGFFRGRWGDRIDYMHFSYFGT